MPALLPGELANNALSIPDRTSSVLRYAVTERNGLVNARIEQLPDTYKDESLKDMDWYQPWFVLAADKPL